MKSTCLYYLPGGSVAGVPSYRIHPVRAPSSLSTQGVVGCIFCCYDYGRQKPVNDPSAGCAQCRPRRRRRPSACGAARSRCAASARPAPSPTRAAASRWRARAAPAPTATRRARSRPRPPCPTRPPRHTRRSSVRRTRV